MLDQMFLSSQVKQTCLFVSNKNVIYELSHKLLNNLRLSIYLKKEVYSL